MIALRKFKRLDVRPMLARGEEPYQAIRRRVDTLQSGEGLLLIAPFLPSPLIEKLGSEGYRSKVEPCSAGKWLVYFWREPDRSGV